MMPSTLPPTNTYVSDYTCDAAPWNKYSEAFFPYAVELIEEILVNRHIAELTGTNGILFKHCIRRGSAYQVDRGSFDEPEVASIPLSHYVVGWSAIVSIDVGHAGIVAVELGTIP